VDQLGQVLNGVDVVVGRRRNQAHAGGRVAHLGNPGVDLTAGQLSALAGLGSLGHLDLDFPGLGQVEAGDAEPTRGHLLDGAVFGVALLVGPGVAFGVFAPLAGVGLAADAVHGDGQGFVGFLRDRPVAHGPGLEAGHDGLNRLHLIQGNRFPLLELQQIPQAEELLFLLVDDLGVLFVQPRNRRYAPLFADRGSPPG
jgi:hypothetical protein